MATRTRGLRTGGPSPAASFAAVLILGAAVAGFVAQGIADRHERAGDRRRAAADASRFGAELDALIARTGQVAAAASGGGPSFRVTGRQIVDAGEVRAFALAPPDGGQIQSVVARGSVPGLTTDLAHLGLAKAVADAEVATVARVIGPVDLPSGSAIVVLAPVYPAGTDASVDARRAATSAIVAGVALVDDLRRPPGEPALWPGSKVQIRTASGRFGTPIDDPLLTATVRAGAAPWRIAVGGRGSQALPVGWAILLAGAIAAAAGYAMLERQIRQRDRAEGEAELRASQLEIIATTSSSLQQSLDLAELLPAFCVNVANEFDLSCISILVVDDDGNLVETFRLGEQRTTDQMFELELRRGWRAVGRLAAWTPSHLDTGAQQSLQALADLLAVAVSNAYLYQREQQAVTRLSELDALKNAFLGTVSHELRTSTTAVQGFGELLTEHWDTLPEERRKELAARIRRQAGSLRHLVDDLLDYARLEHQSLQVTPRRVVLGDLVEQLVDSMSPLVAGHEVVVEGDRSVSAWADPIAIERILANLLSNAGKYSPTGTTVTVTIERLGDRARLKVADQGPGIPVEERHRVFVRFYRLSNAETLKTRGAGIGLSILHDFADRSGAIVTIDDAPGGGALVIVDFPTEPLTAPDVFQELST